MPRRYTYRNGRRYYYKSSPYRRRRIIGRAPTKKRRSYSSRNRRTGGFLGKEKKFVDYNLSDSAIVGTTWSGGTEKNAGSGTISGVAQGDGESERDGRVYWIDSVHIRGFIDYDAVEAAAAPLNDIICRLALVLDKQCNGAEFSGEEVFASIGSGEDVNSFRNLQFSHRYTVLKDMTMTIKPQTVNEGAINSFANGQVLRRFEMDYMFKRPIKVQTDGTTAGAASITNYNIGLLAIASSSGLDLTYESRVRFYG